MEKNWGDGKVRGGFNPKFLDEHNKKYTLFELTPTPEGMAIKLENLNQISSLYSDKQKIKKIIEYIKEIRKAINIDYIAHKYSLSYNNKTYLNNLDKKYLTIPANNVFKNIRLRWLLPSYLYGRPMDFFTPLGNKNSSGPDDVEG
ncbi:MAG: hypothetical protein FJ126_04230 [Deltaproteobacteria bacterium]|nr:hypothetical protein [Deltaproteobacteria bacterium]MBM4294097.1 hypothetical protein [Deltaproteobacteria bacterium]